MASPFFVQPAQYGPALQQAAGAVQQFGEQRQEDQRRQEAEDYKQRAKQAMATAFQSGDPGAIRQAVIEFPEIAETATQMFGFTNEQTEKVARETYRRALSETDPQRRAQILEGGIETVRQFGGRPSIMSRDLQMLRESPEAFERSARAGYAALASDQEYEAMFPNVGTGSGDPARVRTIKFALENAGLKPGTPEYEQALRVELGIEPRAGISAAERIAQDPEATTQVAESKGQIKATEEASQQAIKKSGEAYDKLAVIEGTIPKYDRAIQLVREGANTGVLADRFPDLTAEAVELRNVQNQLGLDVISSVTFGALSEKELQVAMQTALPTNLEGDELVNWLEQKKQANKKLAGYLSEAAQFLGTPGNTVADWEAKRRGGQDSDAQSIDDLINKYAD